MPKKISILITALGGEGGGTLMNFILDCARKQDLFVQGTSVPSERVFRRTGDIVIAERPYLHVDHVEMLTFLKTNI